MNKIIAITLLSAALVTPAFAADFATSTPATPFYAGVQVGDGTTLLGGYQIDKMFAVEADYTTIPLSVFGKVGIVRTTATSRYTGYNTATDTSIGLGGGVQYDFNKRISGRLGLDINTYYANNLYIGAIFKF
jgi:long-subunit fatty acid transport protein